MSLELSISILLSLGGIVASVASSMAVVKTKVASMEKLLEEYHMKNDGLRDDLTRYKSDAAVKVALLESNQANHARELSDIKADIKTIMTDVQAVKEAVIKSKKGEE